MKKLSFILLASGFICLPRISQSQTPTKMAAAESPTAANVLKWTNEVLPKMEMLVPKLEQIKANNRGKPASDSLRRLASVSQM